MRLLGIVVAALMACGSGRRADDPVIGRWGGLDGGGPTIEFRADGTLVGVNVSADERCDDDVTLAACGKKNRWARTSRGVEVTIGSVAWNGPSGGGLVGLFDPPKGGPECVCQEDRLVLDLTGDMIAVPGTRERMKRL